MIAYIEIDQYVGDGAGFAGGFGVEFDMPYVIDGHHGAGGDDAANFVRVGDRRCEQKVRDAGLRHEFGLENSRDADASRAQGQLPFRDLRAFVRFGMRAQFFLSCGRSRGHALQVGFEGVEIHQQGGCRNLAFD